MELTKFISIAKIRFQLNIRFRNLSLRDKARLVIVLTGLNAGILFTDYQELAKLFDKRTVYIEIAQASTNVSLESHSSDSVVSVDTRTSESSDNSAGGEQSNPAPSEISKLAKKYRLDADKLNRTSREVEKIADEMNFNWKIVMGIMLTESKGGLLMTGDSGLSKGYYHIYHVNVCELNGNKPNCIKDADRSNLEVSTRWTINRLKRHAVLGEHEMIRSHNGLVRDHSNDWYADYIKKLVKEM